MEIGASCKFTYEAQAFSGVNKIAEMVKQDVRLVTSTYPDEYIPGEACRNLVLYGTVDKSPLLSDLEARSVIDLTEVRGKREVYGFWIVENPLEGVKQALIIAGSDKRGTIYGLFHLSEKIGVSPLVHWNHVWPQQRRSITLTARDNLVSQEPSVKYRGFFINDEWPAFGNWATRHFGGVNAACYAQIFELLLRLKGNYLWPAMWRNVFSEEGPGLESARLADELGVVMSTSHHEPCMRAGEEYTHVRGKDSVYGDAWNFRTNRTGITRFWRDGLIRNAPFENVITMGMRGERDSAILGKEATLQDNIDLLRDVLKTQNDLIRETISPDLDSVPRQMVFFTEVESFFYGTAETRGLMNDPLLDGITLVFSDNNHGYTRTLPTKQMQDHKGGYGMYYHMDMHGGALSYQWIGSTYLPTVWEQMTQAYDFGVREIWLTNIGDVGTQEYGLSYFLDLAYDIDKWGGDEASITQTWTNEWIDRQFAPAFTPARRAMMAQMIWDMNSLTMIRKHEFMNDHVMHPVHFYESENTMALCDSLLKRAETLKRKCPQAQMAAFLSLIYYPVCGTANLMKLWLLAGRNRLFANQNRMEANDLADEIAACMKRDRELIAEYEAIDDGVFSGFGDTEHIGWTHWNDEDDKAAQRHLIFPANNPRMIFSRADDDQYSTGLYWCDRPQIWDDFLRQDVTEVRFELASGSDKPFHYRITSDCPWMRFSKTEGSVSYCERLTLMVEKNLLRGPAEGTFTVTSPDIGDDGVLKVTVRAANVPKPTGAQKGDYVEDTGRIVMEAKHFALAHETKDGAFRLMEPYGRSGSAIRVFPSTACFRNQEDKPFVEYHFWASQSGTYQLQLWMAPTTPVTYEPLQSLAVAMNDGTWTEVNTVHDPTRPYFLSPQWYRETLENLKVVTVDVPVTQGHNSLKLAAIDPGIVLERLILTAPGVTLPESCLGPGESWQFG